MNLQTLWICLNIPLRYVDFRQPGRKPLICVKNKGNWMCTDLRTLNDVPGYGGSFYIKGKLFWLGR